MKKILSLILTVGFLLSFASTASATWVDGYYRDNGTYVSSHYRSNSNGLKYDNYGWDRNSNDYYNSSYNDYSWRQPSWRTQDDYWTGLNSYESNNDYNGYWSY
jgi:hypothetical protein